LGTGTDSDVYALAVSGTTLYLGGDFTMAGGVPASYIAAWDGSTWSALGTGMNSDVFALAMSGTTLYAGGDFTAAGGRTANFIAKWNGNTWSALGSGMDSDVYALAMNGSTLCAGGEFSTAGEVTANYIAAWNGSAWSALGTGIGGGDSEYPPVMALAVSETTLYAGGDFTTAGGVAATNVAAWNGSGWSPLGTGADSYVYALLVNGTTLYAGGDFGTAGGVVANYVAAWDGNAWSALGSGMDNDVDALAVSGTTLYAGGDFSTAGGVAANCVAAWDGNAWSALGSGIGGGSFGETGPYVSVLAADGSGHLLVGGEFSMAGTNVSPFIAQASVSGAPPGGVIQSISVGGGTVTLDCQGASGSPYSVQRATDVQMSLNLTTLLKTNAPSNGLFRFIDPNPPAAAAFYRLLQK
jgi:hypothetical protein